MLRPMGQLEAFVNTISMVASPASSADVATSATIVTTTASASLTLDESSKRCTTKNVEEGLKGVELSECTVEMTKSGVDADRKEEGVVSPKLVEKAGDSTRLAVSRSSLKRESPTFDKSDEEACSEERSPMLMAVPAKRVRVDDKGEESVDQGEFADANVSQSPLLILLFEVSTLFINLSFVSALSSSSCYMFTFPSLFTSIVI